MFYFVVYIFLKQIRFLLGRNLSTSRFEVFSSAINTV